MRPAACRSHSEVQDDLAEHRTDVFRWGMGAVDEVKNFRKKVLTSGGGGEV